MQIAAGVDAACALTEDGEVKCWGQSDTGLLGVPMAEPKLLRDPVTVQGVSPAVQLDGHYIQMCALRADGQVWCWGAGMTKGEPHPPAQPIPDLHDAIDIVTANKFACALRADHSVRCFGPRMDRDRKGSKPFPFESKDAWIEPPVLTFEAQPTERR